MQLTFTKDQLAAAYRRLPETVKEAMSEVDTVTAVEEIGKKNNLHVDQIGKLAQEIGYVLFGLIQPDSFIGNIQRSLFVTPDQARQIGTEVNEQIFQAVQRRVRELTEEEKKAATLEPEIETSSPEMAESVETPSAPPTPPAPPSDLGRAEILKGIENPTPQNPRAWDEDPYIEKP
jgi:hypothetical protein